MNEFMRFNWIINECDVFCGNDDLVFGFMLTDDYRISTYRRLEILIEFKTNNWVNLWHIH